MRNFILILLSSIFVLNLNAQNDKSCLKLKTLIKQKDIYLNCGVKSTQQGLKKSLIKIKLPENTKTWYYSFSTSTESNQGKKLNLKKQLSSLLADSSGLTKADNTKIIVPAGADSIDIFILDKQNSELFLKSSGNDEGKYYFFRDGTVFNKSEAFMDIERFAKGTFYMGLKNASSWNGVYIHIEVVILYEKKAKK